MRDAFGVSKGLYSDEITRVQSHRQKANRRRAAGGTLMGAAAAGGAYAAARPEQVAEAVRAVNHQAFLANKKTTDVGGYKVVGPRSMRAAKVISRVADKPKLAAAGLLGGVFTAGAGVTGAGMAHNARSNKIARQYNAGRHNSKIKIVPVSGKNRF
jgi:hypothetical protein